MLMAFDADLRMWNSMLRDRVAGRMCRCRQQASRLAAAQFVLLALPVADFVEDCVEVQRRDEKSDRAAELIAIHKGCLPGIDTAHFAYHMLPSTTFRTIRIRAECESKSIASSALLDASIHPTPALVEYRILLVTVSHINSGADYVWSSWPELHWFTGIPYGFLRLRNRLL